MAVRKAIKWTLGLYVTHVPIILAACSTALFLVAAFTMAIWNQGWAASLLLVLLCFETFFLPYALLPLATKAPSLLPWVKYRPHDEFGLDGTDRLRQRVIVASLLVLPGIATLGAFSEAAAQPSLWLQVLTGFLLGARVPGAVFALLTLVLALPDFTKVEV
ncbi:hypothetical protein JYU02_00130 [bacterium AH-315-P15]|nr:hypothetical protein [bacterium AH-315-P15]